MEGGRDGGRKGCKEGGKEGERGGRQRKVPGNAGTYSMKNKSWHIRGTEDHVVERAHQQIATFNCLPLTSASALARMLSSSFTYC